MNFAELKLIQIKLRFFTPKILGAVEYVVGFICGLLANKQKSPNVDAFFLQTSVSPLMQHGNKKSCASNEFTCYIIIVSVKQILHETGVCLQPIVNIM